MLKNDLLKLFITGKTHFWYQLYKNKFELKHNICFYENNKLIFVQ